MSKNRKRYGFIHFCWDILLGVCTAGLWWMYLLFKFLRRNS